MDAKPLEAKQKIRLEDIKHKTYYQTIFLLNSALVFAAALGWNEAIKALLSNYFPASSELYSKFGFAILATILLVVVMRYITIKNRK